MEVEIWRNWGHLYIRHWIFSKLARKCHGHTRAARRTTYPRRTEALHHPSQISREHPAPWSQQPAVQMLKKLGYRETYPLWCTAWPQDVLHALQCRCVAWAYQAWARIGHPILTQRTRIGLKTHSRKHDATSTWKLEIRSMILEFVKTTAPWGRD